MYRGDEPIQTAVSFVQQLASKNIPYLFVTNNSSQTPEAVVEKLTSMDIPATKNQVMTSSIATARYIRNKSEQAKCYVIGESGLIAALENEGLTVSDESGEFVV